MKTHLRKLSFLLALSLLILACQAVTGAPMQAPPDNQPAPKSVETSAPAVPIQENTPAAESLTEPVYEATNVSPAPDKFALVKIVGNGVPLNDILYAEAQKAVALGLDPYVDFYADWCPPCRAIEANIGDELMIDAFTGTYIIQLNFDEWERKLSDSGFYVVGIPAYYEIDAEGKSTGRMITGAAWGEDIPQNIAPPMKAFFAGQ